MLYQETGRFGDKVKSFEGEGEREASFLFVCKKDGDAVEQRIDN